MAQSAENTGTQRTARQIVKPALAALAPETGPDMIRGLNLTPAGVLHLLLDPEGSGLEAAQIRAALEPLRPALEALEGVTALDLAIAAPPPDLSPSAPAGPRGLEGVRHVLLVGSGKGGVGKSTVSVNLALALADQGLRVGLLDADIYGPSLPRMLGVGDSRPVAREQMLIPVAAQGIRVMSAGLLFGENRALVWRAPVLVNALRQMLFETAWAPLDVLVIDLPPGTGDVQITLAQQIEVTGALIVSTPQDIALLDARRAIDLFDQVGTPILGLIENMSDHVCPQCGYHDAVFGMGGGAAEAEARGFPLLGTLPLDRRLRETGDHGQPVTRAAPDSEPARAFADLAALLAETLADLDHGAA